MVVPVGASAVGPVSSKVAATVPLATSRSSAVAVASELVPVGSTTVTSFTRSATYPTELTRTRCAASAGCGGSMLLLGSKTEQPSRPDDEQKPTETTKRVQRYTGGLRGWGEERS